MKRIAGRDKFQKFKKTISVFVSIFKILPKEVNLFLLKLVRNTDNSLGLLLRYIFIKILSKKCGDNVSVQPGVFLFNLDKISFGNNISIHPMCYIDGAGNIDIGNDVSIAHSTSILSTNHTWDNTDIPIKYNKGKLDKVVISDDVWIGCGVRLLAGTSIGSRSVLAAGAVINKSVESNTLVGGIPVKKIKSI